MTTGMLADPADEIIIITAGLVESNIKGITCRLAAGSFYFQAANDLHSMTNVGPTPTTYQVLKFVSETIPKPAH
jgi:quercetin dioxygenase-like cupin family protein